MLVNDSLKLKLFIVAIRSKTLPETGVTKFCLQQQMGVIQSAE